MTSGLDPRENIEKIENFLKQANTASVSYVFLPECFYSLSDGTKPTPFLVEEGNEHFFNIQNLAKKYGVYLLGGSAATTNPNGEKVNNRNYNFSPSGELLETYDKIHLFSCDLSRTQSQKVIDESTIYESGNRPKLLEIDEMKIGLGICFDVRFPEMARRYFLAGANLLTFSAAFTVPTGKAHWHALLRARAIENQCYVIAPAQWGQNNEKISTYGHSLVVDPWGEVILDAKEGENFSFVEIDFNYVDEVRRRLKVLPERF